MGPRRERRGNVLGVCIPGQVYEVLQWDGAGKGAEIGGGGGGGGVTAALQWDRAGKGAEIGLASGAGADRLKLQWDRAGKGAKWWSSEIL